MEIRLGDSNDACIVCQSLRNFIFLLQLQKEYEQNLIEQEKKHNVVAKKKDVSFSSTLVLNVSVHLFITNAALKVLF